MNVESMFLNVELQGLQDITIERNVFFIIKYIYFAMLQFNV